VTLRLTSGLSGLSFSRLGHVTHPSLYIPRWTAAVVFATVAFAHALLLPTFEGMDEPAHLSSILQFATGEGRPEPDRARLHVTIERAVGLAPGPYEQWPEMRAWIGATTYVEWQRLPSAERERRRRALDALRVDGWQASIRENWQAQHPPLYYMVMGAVVRALGGGEFARSHRVARLASAALFATTGLFLTAFLTGRWGASPAAALFVCLFPMWYVMGARIANDALAIPAFTLASLWTIDQIRRPVSEWSAGPWIAAGLGGALALAAKAYGLAFLPAAALATVYAVIQAARGLAPWRSACYPAVAIGLTLGVNAWWLAENLANTGFITGQNENADLAARGIVSLADRLPYAIRLIVDEPGMLGITLARAATQALFVSNWTFGAAPTWFYALQVLTLGLVLAGTRRPSSTPLKAAAVVAAASAGTILVGSAKAVVDFYILFGETRLAQGWYVWGAAGAVAAALALAFDAAPPRRQRVVLWLQIACLVTAFATDAMFWSGRYARHPVWRTPVRVADAEPTAPEPREPSKP
jgi:hypothetical protein